MEQNRPGPGFLDQLFTRQERLAFVFLLAAGFGGLLLADWQRNWPTLPAAPVVLEVRVNSAAPEELAALPGIGPVMARRIVADRQLHGRFLTLTDLSRVKGITPKVLQKFKGLVRFD